MRELGYRTVDALVEWLTDESRPPIARAAPDELAARLHGAVPESFDDALRVLFEDVLPFTSRASHPRFFAFVPFSGTWPGALGDFIAAAANVYAGSWMEAAGPSQVELEVVRWFSDWVGYPAGSAGVLVSGGSAANLTGLACAREARAGAMTGRVLVYLSGPGHPADPGGPPLLGLWP